MRKPGRAMGRATALGELLAGGALHLVCPRTYERLVPPELPDARAWATATGVAEIATAAPLVAPSTPRWGGRADAGLPFAFVPAYLHTFRVVQQRPVSLAVAAVRLPLQVPMIAAALPIARSR